MKKIIALLLISITLLSGCSKYGFVRLKYPTAPLTILPDNIHTIAIVNRSLTASQDKKNSVLESVISGEVAGSDKLASDECLKGVFDRINGWRQISIVIPSKTRLYGTGTRETPEILDWNVVKKICDSTKADALLVLETFDSNSDLLSGAITNQVNSLITTGAPANPAAPRQIRMNVLCFWRLYDPVNKKIVDQYQSTSYLTFNAGGANFSVPPPDALPQTAYAAGEEYIQRFLPGYYFVKRDMYKRGKGSAKEQFKTAFRRSEVADWQGASELWEVLTKSPSRVNAGRACLDMAVACEVLGKTDEALKWANKAFEDYGNKLARDYSNVLRQRINIE